jgi:hypothetical protein
VARTHALAPQRSRHRHPPDEAEVRMLRSSFQSSDDCVGRVATKRDMASFGLLGGIDQSWVRICRLTRSLEDVVDEGPVRDRWGSSSRPSAVSV